MWKRNRSRESRGQEARGGGTPLSRREALRRLGLGGVVAGTAAAGLTGAAKAAAEGDVTLKDALGGLFQDHFQRMDPEEVQETLARLERRYRAKYGVDIEVGHTDPIPGTLWGYAINLSQCKGYRECVRACVEENNESRSPEIQYIRVLEMPDGTDNLEAGDHYYDHEMAPQPGKWYLPVQCQQCDEPPCVDACPVKATWQEPDGIVVVDYDWCIGCRYCMTACPYWARHFNWTEPGIDPEQINPQTEYLSNRPRPQGVVEKCTFCLHRVRNNRLPACLEACPTGARVFGNLLDPESDIRYVLEHKKVFRLKEDLGTEPKFWYYTD